MSNDTQPEIRFPGFTDDWEQRKLKEFGKSTGGTSIESEFVEGGKYKVISIGSYSEQSVYTDQNIRAELTDKTRNRVLNKGDLTMILNDKTASGNIIGRVLLIDSNDSYVYNQRTERIEPDHKKYDSQFLYHMLNAPMIRSKIIKQAQGNTQIYVNWSAIGELDYLVPNLDEQREIGAFFFNLNNLITLHQRKLDLLKETKKGFLQKMFPKNGAKVPEIRFPGFTEDWEERRLQEVVDRYDNLRIPITASKRVAGNTPYYGANGIQGYVEGYTHDGEFILVAEDGANDLKNYPVQYVDGKVWVNNHAHVIQAKENLADNMFLMNAIRSINIEPFLVGGGRAKLNADVLMKLEVIIPLKSEQQKIGNFFKQLDDTITLHQRKLDLLKEMKKGFLQKMFV
ncbi:TPA: restriction endonuclease subunit S [Enterococcus faecium]|nr:MULTISPECIES: restriction endonuclease subunit S [Enterococcus]RXU74040.1 restriction endonuclease subunit S [Enterococcus faecium]TKQ48167.1 restriction endonuclease subunit S [Enterococcus faecium]